MSASQVQGPVERNTASDERLITRVGDIVVYTTVLIGYVLNLLVKDAPTPTGFVLFTVANALYLLVAWRMWSRYRRERRVDRWVGLELGLVITLTIFPSILLPLGIEFDALLFLATIAIVMTILPTWAGLAVTTLLYISLPFLSSVAPKQALVGIG